NASFRLKAISDPWFRENITRLGWIGLDLFPQVANKDAQIFGLFHRVSTPDVGEQGAMSEYLSWMANQIGEQVELFGRQVNLFVAHPNFALFKIDMKITLVDRNRF